MIFPINQSESEIEFSEPVPGMHFLHLYEKPDCHAVFDALLGLLSNTPLKPQNTWIFSTLGRLLPNENLSVLEILACDNFDVFYLVDSVKKDTPNGVHSFEIAFTCQLDTIAEILKLPAFWGVSMNIVGWLVKSSNYLPFKFDGWKLRKPPTDFLLGFSPCNEASGVEFFSYERQTLFHFAGLPD